MNNLEKILKQQNVTKSELARQLRVSRQRVNNWTRGKNYPARELIKLISAYLKVPIDKLFFEE
jgi:transcriptional regulator with XRE-family HTH domain